MHTVTLSNKHNRQRFIKGQENVYQQLVNLEYLKMSQLMCHLIRHESLTLIDKHTELPIRNKQIKPLIKGLIAEQRNDYLALFTCLVAFDSYINTLEHVDGLAARDMKIVAAQHMLSDILDQRHLLRTGLSHNDVLYYPVKENESNEDQSNQLLQLKREEALTCLLEQLDLTAPVDMHNTTLNAPKLLWKKLHDNNPDLFPPDEQENSLMLNFIEQQQMCAFDDDRLVELYEFKSIRKE